MRRWWGSGRRVPVETSTPCCCRGERTVQGGLAAAGRATDSDTVAAAAVDCLATQSVRCRLNARKAVLVPVAVLNNIVVVVVVVVVSLVILDWPTGIRVLILSWTSTCSSSLPTRISPLARLLLPPVSSLTIHTVSSRNHTAQPWSPSSMTASTRMPTAPSPSSQMPIAS